MSPVGTPDGPPYVGRRTLEVWTAAAVAAAGAVVCAESLTHDIGWGATGPGPGYFPFRVGLLLIGAAAVRALQSVRMGVREPFVTREQLRHSVHVFWPMALLVIAMFPLGCYVPSAAYLAWMTRRHGRYRWPAAMAFGVGVMAAFFVVFDVWFRVPLAKGPVERALGLW